MTDFRPEDWLSKPDGLADRLRAAREANNGMLAQQLGEVLGWDPAKVSRTENGRRVPTAADIRAWAASTNTGDDERDQMLAMLEEFNSLRSSWRERVKYGRRPIQAGYTKLYQDTREFRIFQTMWVPGVLQTPDYARQAIETAAALLDAPRTDIPEAVAERMRRQASLYEPTKRFEIILAESVLRSLPCDPPVMRVQLDRLTSAIGLPNMRFGIVPQMFRLSLALENSFVLYDDMGVVETYVGETRHFTEEAKTLGRAMDLLWAQAVEGDAARELINAAKADLPAG